MKWNVLFFTQEYLKIKFKSVFSPFHNWRTSRATKYSCDWKYQIWVVNCSQGICKWKITHTKLARFKAPFCDVNAVYLAINLALICDVQWKRVLYDNAIGSHEWPDNRTIGRAPMQLAERRSFVHALHCTNARASQMGYLYMYRPFPSLFSRNGWIQQKILPLKKTKATTKIKVNCSLKQICLIYKAYCIRKIFAPVLISLFSLFLLVSGLRFG